MVKKYTLVTVSLKVAAYILTILQSSAIFVLALSFFVVSLPFTFLFGYLAVILSLFGRRRRIKAVNEMIKNKKVTVFFASKGKQLSPDSFFAANLRDIKERRGGVAVIVSPYFFSPKGISDAKKAYALMRIEEKDIIIVRRHFFFTLNKRLFSDFKKDVTMIY